MTDILLFHPEQPLLFNTGFFIFFFLVFIAGYTLLSGRRTTAVRLLYVTCFSYYFYYKNAGAWCMLLAIITLVNFFCALRMEKATEQKMRRRWMLVAVVFMLGQLAFFKYTNFLLGSLAGVGLLAEGTQLDLPMLIGISFFTFQSMSYIIDVYRRQMEPSHSLTDFAFFVSFFPTLLAGPILRARTFLPQLREPVVVTHAMMGSGTWFIIMGLFKKCVISDYISQNFVSRIFDNPALYSGLENLLGVYGYALQLYCDFSGYSDMAIGIALIMGYRLAQNFNFPYKSQNITDFWRRWHISLSSWLRDYIYIPLGGNRKGRVRMYLNNLATMLIGGLWHGAAWKFVFWGAMHGVGLVVHKASRPYLERLGSGRLVKTLSWLVTMCFVAALWVFFRADSFADSCVILGSLAGDYSVAKIAAFADARAAWLILMAVIVVAHSLPTAFWTHASALFVRTPWVVKLLLFIIVVQLVLEFRSESVTPFIYFQF